MVSICLWGKRCKQRCAYRERTGCAWNFCRIWLKLIIIYDDLCMWKQLKMNTAVIKAVQTIAKKRLIKMVRATKLTKEDSNHRNLAVRLLMFEERLGHPLHDFLRNHWYLATHSLIDPYLSFIIIFVLSLASILFATSSACITSKIWFLIYGPTKWLFSCTDYTVSY